MAKIADDKLRGRAKDQFARQERFDKTDFLAALAGCRTNFNNGITELTFAIGPGEQDRALAVRLARGELVLVTVERVSMKGASRAKRSAAEVRE